MIPVCRYGGATFGKKLIPSNAQNLIELNVAVVVFVVVVVVVVVVKSCKQAEKREERENK